MALDAILAAHVTYMQGWSKVDHQDDSLATYRSELPKDTYNGVIRTTRADLREALAEARKRLDGVPRVWWAGPDSTPGAADRLAALGAEPAVEMPIMTLDLRRMDDAAAPAGLRIGEVADLGAYVDVYTERTPLPPAVKSAVIERERTFAGDGKLVRLAGQLDGRTVASAALWLSHDVATLFCVGTLAAYRRRGIGAAITSAALGVARDRGVRVAGLTASAMGRPVYERVGFRRVAAYRLLTF